MISSNFCEQRGSNELKENLIFLVTSRRHSSTYDVKYPNFDECRRKSTLDAKVASRDTEPNRVAFTRAVKGGEVRELIFEQFFLLVAFGSFGLWGAKEGVQLLLYSKVDALEL